MQREPSRLKPLITTLALGALLAGGCQLPTHAYRARVVGGPVQPTPAVPMLPGAGPMAVQPMPAQPQWNTPQPGGPQPLIPARPGTPVQSNMPTQPAPPMVSAGLVLEKVGPSQATVGALVTYRIEVQAASGGAREVTVHDQLARGLAYASSTPVATVHGDQLEWKLGSLRGGELRTIEVSFRAEQPGVFNHCAVARTADGQTSQDCVSTAVLIPDLEVWVRVTGSDTAMVGDRVTFEITVTNRSSLPATGLMISDQFDSGLEHAAAASPIEKDLGQLAGGESTTIGVTFRVAHAGRLCNRVEVRGESGVRGTAEACVTAMMAAPPSSERPPERPLNLPPPPAQGPSAAPPAAVPASPPQSFAKASVQLKVIGPEEEPVDAVAKFSLEVKNTGEGPLTNLILTASQDAMLKPVQATDGYDWDDRGNLFWKFSRLPAGESRRVELHCRCENVARAACVRVTASTREGAVAEGDACVEIRRPAPADRSPDPAAAPPGRGESQLAMTVTDLTDPVKTKTDVTYEIRVVNNGTAAARNVALLVVVPEEMTVNRLGTTGAGTGYDIDLGQNVRFNPIAEVLPGEKRTFRVRAQADKAGEVTLEAVLKSDSLPRPMSVKEKTTVFERGE